MKQRLLLVVTLLLLCTMAGLAQRAIQLTEILYDIPASPNGDPNGDGTRQSAGDEFFELYNSSAAPVDISGYVMVEREGQVVFTFPVGTTMQPGAFVVVFGNAITDPWGANLPAGTLKFSHYTGATNQGFGPVTTKTGTTKTNLASNGDRVMIVDPLLADTVAEVSWGWDNQVPPQKVLPLSSTGIYLDENHTVLGDSIMNSIGQAITVQRSTGKWGRHKEVASDTNTYFSPGAFPDGATGVEEQSDGLTPAHVELNQNYPNPFNPTTVIHFSLANESAVTLKVFNCLGQEVAIVLDRTMGAGQFFVNFDASQLSAGVYLYTLKTGQHTQTKRMILLK